MNIQVTDKLGDGWVVMAPGYYRGTTPNVHMWCWVLTGPPSVVDDYPAIPIPVFTEWWT